MKVLNNNRLSRANVENNSSILLRQTETMYYRFDTSEASSASLHKLRSCPKASVAGTAFFTASLRCFLPRFGTFHGTWMIFEGFARIFATLCLMFVRVFEEFVLSFSFRVVLSSVGFSSCERLRLPGVATVFSFLRHLARLF